MGCLGEDGVNKDVSALAPRLRVGLGVPSLGWEFGGQQGFACLCFHRQLIPVEEIPWEYTQEEIPHTQLSPPWRTEASQKHP